MPKDDAGTPARGLRTLSRDPGPGAIARRLEFLDGARGWAALFVVLYHVFCNGLPPSDWAATGLRLWLPFNGFVAVSVFFVVSGFALSIGFVATGDRRGLARIAVGRYVRLALPILAACALVHGLLVAGWIAPVSERPSPFNQYLTFDATLWHLLRFSLLEVFFGYDPQRSYIIPLWTIPLEVMGSVIVIGGLVLVGRARWRWIAYVLALGAFLWAESLYALFVAGVLLAEWHVAGRLARMPRGVTAVLCGIGLAAPFLLPWEVNAATMAGVLALCAGVLGSPRALRALSSPLSAALGRLSFPLYLMHGPVMFAVGAPLLAAWGGRPALMVVAGLLTVAASLVASLILVPVNDGAIRLARGIGRAIVAKAKAPVAA